MQFIVLKRTNDRKSHKPLKKYTALPLFDLKFDQFSWIAVNKLYSGTNHVRLFLD